MNVKKDYKGYQPKEENVIKLSKYVESRAKSAFKTHVSLNTPISAPTNKTASITQNKRFK